MDIEQGMKQKIRYILLSALLMMSGGSAMAQRVVGAGEGYDFDFLTPKTYEIGGIAFEGADNFDPRMVLLIAGLQVGDEIKLPGDKIAAAIDNLWKQGLFEDVQVRVSRLQGNVAFLKIVLKERPRMNGFRFTGVKKNEASKLREEMHLTAGDVVTENLLRTSANKIKGYYMGKGYTRADVQVELEPDSNGRVSLNYIVDRGKQVKIDSLIFVGNNEVSTTTLQSEMGHTHDVHYFKKLRFWTRGFWHKSRYIEADFREDLEKVLDYYNKEGYRDARVVSDTVWDVASTDLKLSNKKKRNQERVKVKVQLYEGRQYYFRNITFSGNTIYTDETLHRALRIEKGDIYNRTTLQRNITYNPSGSDISSLYMDHGYLFFHATPVEVAVEGDSIDIEIRIYEGKQAKIRNVSVEGNTITNDNVIMRELRTRPGDLFSRDALIRSQRELMTLNFFEQNGGVEPVPKPNADDGTVDIVYKVREGHTSQITLNGSYAGRNQQTGRHFFVGQVGLQLNNFSARNLFNKKSWAPLPAGDGQKLGISASSSGNSYMALQASFTEPWLGGKRPQSFSVSVYHTLYSNAILYKPENENYWSIKTTGGMVSFGRRLKWPDDYFTLSHAISYKHYYLDNYQIGAGNPFKDGHANELSYILTLERNSLDSPIFPRSGSDVAIAGFITPPYSLFSQKDYSSLSTNELYRWVEYYKVNLRGTWMLNVVGDLVLSTRFRFGFLGYFNKDIGASPFGRYNLGGDGLTSYNFDGREIVPLRGYKNNSLSPDGGGSVFDRFTLELRHPIIEQPYVTAWLQAFLEGGNCWSDISEFQPFKLYTSAGLGVHLYLPQLGLIGLDWGYGFNDPDGLGIGGSQFHFSIGQSID